MMFTATPLNAMHARSIRMGISRTLIYRLDTYAHATGWDERPDRILTHVQTQHMSF